MNSNDVDLHSLKKQIEELEIDNSRLENDGETAATALVKYVIDNKPSTDKGTSAYRKWEQDARAALKAVKLYLVKFETLDDDVIPTLKAINRQSN